jgi:hypothetical protein
VNIANIALRTVGLLALLHSRALASGMDNSVVISPGAAAASQSGDWRFNGELSVTRYWSAFGLGGVFGGTPDRTFLELQPVAVLDFSSASEMKLILVGLNPGVVFDHARATHTGFQATLWASFLYGCCHGGFFGLPVVPFLRTEIYEHDASLSLGLMLKIPIPIPLGGPSDSAPRP